MSDNETRIQKIKRSFEKQHHTRMQNTSWQMPREARQELEDELYQENVEDSTDEYVDYLMICFW